MSTYLEDLAKANWKKAANLTKRQQKEILQAYENAFWVHFNKFKDNPNENASKAFEKEYTEHMFKQIKEITNKYALEMSDEVFMDYNMFNVISKHTDLLDPLGGLAFNKIIRSMSNDVVKQLIAGDIYKDGRGLSQRIWNVVSNDGKKLHEVIQACAAANLGSAEMSKVLAKFVKPGSATEWDRKKIREKLGPGYASWNKNFNYEALRLARTTISHTATLSMKQIGAANPFIQKVRWSSVHAIGRTCATCADRDGRLYTLQRVPFDHPNGLCSLIPEVPDLDVIGDKLKDWCNGESVPEMDKWWAKYKGTPLPDAMKQALHKRLNKPMDKNYKYDNKFSNVKKELTKDEWNDVKVILNNMPKECRDLLSKTNYSFKLIDTKNNGAYYNPADGFIYLDKVTELKRCKCGEYTTLFHEWGHKADFTDTYKISEL